MHLNRPGDTRSNNFRGFAVSCLVLPKKRVVSTIPEAWASGSEILIWIYGDGINVAARLEALAEPGGICVSRVVRDQVRDKLAFSFEDMGEQQVKNIARPIRVHRIVLGEKSNRSETATSEPQQTPPLALPASVLSGLHR